MPVTLASFIVKLANADAIVTNATQPAVGTRAANNRRRDVFFKVGEEKATMLPTSERVDINLLKSDNHSMPDRSCLQCEHSPS